MANRLSEKSDLYYRLGVLFGPLEEIVASPADYTVQERAAVIARYNAEYLKLIHQFQRFSVSQPGHDYAIEYERFFNALNGVKARLVHGSKLEEILPGQLQQARDAIDAVPVPPVSVIHAAGTPFSTYCRIRELCEVDATKSVTWIDAYVDSSIFHRYLAAARTTTQITLVTTEPSQSASRRDKDRWLAFLDVSRLFAKEKGATQYSLYVAPSVHDRWLVFDSSRIYSLGGSAKDAGSRDHFTLASVEPSTENLSLVTATITGATELFGPTVAQHA